MSETTTVSGPAMTVVIGGGTMGAGIAHELLAAGGQVVIVETIAARVAAAAEAVLSSLRRAAELGKLSGDPEKIHAGLSVVESLDAVPAAGVELVVEAVPELPELKRDVLARAAAACPDAVLASNTSSLSIGDLASAVDDPARVLGMHFFNPVPAQRLVELIVHAGTDPAVLDRVRGWVAALGKTPIVVRDSPGFATSRLGVLVGLEAIRMLAEGVASAADIDTGMTLGYRWPMGPLRLTDLVGLDVRLAVAEYLAAELGPRFEPPPLLREKVAAGELGRKTGRGFFDWPTG